MERGKKGKSYGFSKDSEDSKANKIKILSLLVLLKLLPLLFYVVNLHLFYFTFWRCLQPAGLCPRGRAFFDGQMAQSGR